MCFSFGFAKQKELLQPHGIPLLVSLLKSMHTLKKKKSHLIKAWHRSQLAPFPDLREDFFVLIFHTPNIYETLMCASLGCSCSATASRQFGQSSSPRLCWAKLAKNPTILIISLVRIVWWNRNDISLTQQVEKGQWKESSPDFKLWLQPQT